MPCSSLPPSKLWTNQRQDSPQRFQFPPLTRSWSSIHILPPRRPLLSSSLLQHSRSITIRWRRTCRNIQLFLCSRTTSLRLSLRQVRTCEHTICFSIAQRHYTTCRLASFYVFGSVDRVCHSQWFGKWRVLLRHTACYQFVVWESEDACGDGNDHYGVGSRISFGECFLIREV
jgi:hypothetical protein